ncbi:hypothetical protein EDD36DRAFT_480893 [Exophiala viscosa]|uniref:Uncharacterized protein n=1 Tax=Exophiala viscosa TaxID=2486360 RepID=A0AAN6E905_9EURO|nr:hypothetical protein EDD36DRAFT_480893 [Exophiala viscosa]
MASRTDVVNQQASDKKDVTPLPPSESETPNVNTVSQDSETAKTTTRETSTRPESLSAASPKPWVLAGEAGTLGQPNLPKEDPGNYTKSNWALDAVILTLLNKDRGPDSQEKYHDLILPSDVDSAVSLARQIGLNKYNELKGKSSRYRRNGDLHQWLTDGPDFELWLKRFRAGPTACAGVDFGQQKADRPTQRQNGALTKPQQELVAEPGTRQGTDRQLRTDSVERRLPLDQIYSRPQSRSLDLGTGFGTIRQSDQVFQTLQKQKEQVQMSNANGAMPGSSRLQPSLVPRERPTTEMFQLPGEGETRQRTSTEFGGYRDRRNSDSDDYAHERSPERNGKTPEIRNRDDVNVFRTMADEARKETEQLRAELKEKDNRVEKLNKEMAEVRNALGSLKYQRPDETGPERIQRRRDPALDEENGFPEPSRRPRNRTSTNEAFRTGPSRGMANRLRNFQGGFVREDPIQILEDEPQPEPEQPQVPDAIEAILQKLNEMEQKIEQVTNRPPTEPPSARDEARDELEFHRRRVELLEQKTRMSEDRVSQDRRHAGSLDRKEYTRNGHPGDNEELLVKRNNLPRLTPQTIMIWDPEDRSPRFFIDRYHFVATLYSTEEVLRVLPLCLAGDAIEWHGNLPWSVKQEMNTKMEKWDEQILAEYKPNTGEAYQRARRLRFRFGDSTLSLNSYLRQKAALLRDASIFDHAAIINEAWNGMDTEMKTRLVMKRDETWPEFVDRAKEVEIPARLAYEKMGWSSGQSRRPQRTGASYTSSGWNREQKRSPGRKPSSPKARYQAYKDTSTEKPRTRNGDKGLSSSDRRPAENQDKDTKKDYGRSRNNGDEYRQRRGTEGQRDRNGYQDRGRGRDGDRGRDRDRGQDKDRRGRNAYLVEEDGDTSMTEMGLEDTSDQEAMGELNDYSSDHSDQGN